MENIMAEKKSYNHLALRGAPVDDMEFVERFNLPVEVAYTNKINDVMLDMVHKDNMDHFLEQGMSEKESKMKADANKMDAMKGIREMLAKKGML